MILVRTSLLSLQFLLSNLKLLSFAFRGVLPCKEFFISGGDCLQRRYLNKPQIELLVYVNGFLIQLSGLQNPSSRSGVLFIMFLRIICQCYLYLCFFPTYDMLTSWQMPGFQDARDSKNNNEVVRW
jgi:hypothetical protein